MSDGKLKLTYRAVETLVPYDRNARTHSPVQVQQIADSIEAFGMAGAIVVREGMIAKGHGTLAACSLLYGQGKRIYPPPGPSAPEDQRPEAFPAGKVPVLDASGWTDEQFRAYVIADNKLALNAGWDEALLAGELQALQASDFDVGVIGFARDELFRLLPNGGGKTDPDAAPPAPAVPVSQLGDVWVLGDHRLVCGDSTHPETVKQALGGSRPHLMVTEPPYGVEYDPSWRQKAGVGSAGAATGKVLNDHRADWREVWALFPGSVVYVWHGGLHAGTVEDSLVACGFKIRAQIVWVKSRPALSRGHYHWQHEPALYGVKEGEQDDHWRFVPEHELVGYAVKEGATADWHGGRKQSTVWFIEHVKSDTGHGTQKPIEAMRRPILNNSDPGDPVFEPFSGSGTTLMACEITGRACRALELNPGYVDVGVKRWQDFTGRQAVLEGSGKTFAQVAAERQKPAAAAPAPAEPGKAPTKAAARRKAA